MQFSEWFQRQLKRREWTQSDFARKANISPGTVHTWYHGTRLPDPASCDLIADVFGVTYAEVMQVAGHLPPDRPTSEDDPRILIYALVDRVDWEKDNRLSTIEAMMRHWIEDDRKVSGKAARSDAPPSLVP